ncbi:MAG: hypothetical protein HYX53_14530 [Chloroflexi bacterium]|nr:hypothetical protein [Chloroflexota bacterium]
MTQAEVDSLRDLDLIFLGSDREAAGAETAIALEVSYTINPDDVERAATRADILRRAGYRSIPLVGGDWLADDARPLAEQYGVRVDLRRLST